MMKSKNRPFPLEELLDKNVQGYLSGHEELMEQVQKEIIKQESIIAERIEQENPYKQESDFVSELETLDGKTLYDRLPNIEEVYPRKVADAKIKFDFYNREFVRATAIKEDEVRKEKYDAIGRVLVKDMQEQLWMRRSAWEMSLIDTLRKEYLQKLYEQIERFKKLEKILSPFLGRTGVLWDMSSGLFRNRGFEILEAYSDLLERDESLKELADLLGRHARAQHEYEKELISQSVISTEWNPRPAYRGQVAGICTSNEISSALPSELALFRKVTTKRLFEKKFAEKNLLSFKYENVLPQDKVETRMTEVPKEENKGPIVICCDTSGSMNGTPENIAKTITFALSKKAIEEKRKCYLISFSTSIECLDLSDFKKGNSLEKLISFLRMSFRGGTDAFPALKHSLELLKQDDWKNADVLMISDFIFSSLPENLVNAIDEQKKRNSKFYSLVIGNSGNRNAMTCFNHNWSYNYYDPNASRKLVEQLHDFGKEDFSNVEKEDP